MARYYFYPTETVQGHEIWKKGKCRYSQVISYKRENKSKGLFINRNTMAMELLFDSGKA